MLSVAVILLTSCTSTSEPVRTEQPWDPGLPSLEQAGSPEGYVWGRGIVHLHSPWSHDACDGAYEEGESIESCLDDFREAICTNSLDYVFVTDHPSFAAYQSIEDLLWSEGGDTLLFDGDSPVANEMACPNGNTPIYMPGFEDELMPVGITRHYSDDEDERHELYNDYDGGAVEALSEMGAVVLVAHTEHRELGVLSELAGHGLAGVEMFNLHAMVDPNKRSEDLGLDPTSWLTDAAPFTSPDGTAEPDLMFLAFYQEQEVSVKLWDSLSALGPTVGVAGTDAHQNVINLPLRDGERLDSYRRMIRWFSNWLLASEDTPTGYREALAAGRLFTVFEALGTPEGMDVFVLGEAGRIEVGGEAAVGDIMHVVCPVLSYDSPQNLETPRIEAVIYRDGNELSRGCGQHSLDEGGVYRVVFEMTPHHLSGFMGDVADNFIHPFPWIYANPFRVQ
jgi:hypothetical protein